MVSPTALLQRARRITEEKGLLGTVSGAPGAIFRLLVPPPVPRHPFDVAHGTDTSGMLLPTRLPAGHRHAVHVQSYWGTHPSLFEGAIAAWRQTLTEPLERYSFYDIGCGKGRALLMASELPFRSVVGIELHPPLVEIAERNIALWHQKPRSAGSLEVRCADALTFALPDEPAVVYLYHPFGAAVMAPFVDHLAQLAARRSAPLDMIYANPILKDLVGAADGVELLTEGEVTFTASEAAVDAFHDASHHFAVFRLPGGLEAAER